MLYKCLYRFYQNYFCPAYVYLFPRNTKAVNAEKKIKTVPLKQEFDIANDLIKIKYDMNGVDYTLCVPRTNLELDIFNLHQHIIKKRKKRTLSSHYVIKAYLNDEEDITHQINEHLGDRCFHLNITSYEVKWILTPEQIKRFNSITIHTASLNTISFTHIRDKLSYDKIVK